MGVNYCIKAKYPVFLTFWKYSKLLETLEKDGLISSEDSIRAEFASGAEAAKRINKAIKNYLSKLYKEDPDTYINCYYNFWCEGEEAQDNIFRLLDAAGSLYRNFGFIQSAQSGDARFPYGNQFWLVKTERFSRRIAKFYIPTAEISRFGGSLHRFRVYYKNEDMLEFDHGSVSVLLGKQNQC